MTFFKGKKCIYFAFSGSCGGQGRYNSVSASIATTHLNTTTQKWSSPQEVNNYYHYKHSSSAYNTLYSDTDNLHLGLFNQRSFLVSVEIERGCKPILTAKFMPGPTKSRFLWQKSEEEEGKQELVLENKDSKKSSSAMLSMKTLMTIGFSAAGIFVVVVLFVCMIRSVVRRNKTCNVNGL